MDVTPYLKTRFKALQKRLAQSEVGWYVVSQTANLKYLTGIHTLSSHHRELFILVSPKSVHFIHSPLIALPKYLEKLGRLTAFGTSSPLSSLLKTIVTTPSVYGDFSDLKMEEVMSIEQRSGLKLIASEKIVEANRQLKDDFELVQIRSACRIASNVWKNIKKRIQVGVTEKEIGQTINSLILEHGGEIGEEFAPIVAFGENSSIPHHQTGESILKANQVVLVDFGCKVNGYWSDMTRTIQIGAEKEKEFVQIESVVKTAYTKALSNIESNLDIQTTDQLVVNHLESNGVGGMMPHTTGHGIGLEVHEPPSISRYSPRYHIRHREIFTIEPGVYIPGKWGYRHENTLEMTAQGVRVLTETDA